MAEMNTSLARSSRAPGMLSALCVLVASAPVGAQWQMKDGRSVSVGGLYSGLAYEREDILLTPEWMLEQAWELAQELCVEVNWRRWRVLRGMAADGCLEGVAPFPTIPGETKHPPRIWGSENSVGENAIAAVAAVPIRLKAGTKPIRVEILDALNKAARAMYGGGDSEIELGMLWRPEGLDRLEARESSEIATALLKSAEPGAYWDFCRAVHQWTKETGPGESDKDLEDGLPWVLPWRDRRLVPSSGSIPDKERRGRTIHVRGSPEFYGAVVVSLRAMRKVGEALDESRVSNQGPGRTWTEYVDDYIQWAEMLKRWQQALAGGGTIPAAQLDQMYAHLIGHGFSRSLEETEILREGKRVVVRGRLEHVTVEAHVGGRERRLTGVVLRVEPGRR